MNFQNPFARMNILSKAFKSHMVFKLEISRGSYNHLQYSLKLTKKLEKGETFMEILIADFIKFFGLLPNFYFCKIRLGNFTKISLFLSPCVVR